jgi:DNA invertase Pin-like site-specific DNA recombinase
MLIGYARTSTLEQEAGLDAQLRDLKALGCKRIYSEQASSVSERPELEALLKSLRKGDKLIVTKLDRLARSVIHLGQIVERIQESGADLQIVAMGVDTSTATGKLMLNVLGSVAQFEREMMLERQREGIAKAKAEGKYKGKKAKFATERALELKRQGKSLRQIAENLGVSKQAVQQRLAGLE